MGYIAILFLFNCKSWDYTIKVFKSPLFIAYFNALKVIFSALFESRFLFHLQTFKQPF